MAESSFDQSIQKLNVLFKFSGLSLKHDKIIKFRWLYTFNFLWVLSATIASFYYIIVGAAQGKNFVELTSVAPCLTFTILAIIKSLYHIINENEVDKLINGLNEQEIKERKRKSSDEKETIIREDRSFLNTVINVLYFLNCSMIVVFDMTPLILIGVKYYQTNEFEMLLPYLDVFSFIPYEFKYWPFAFIHQVWSECIVLLDMGAADYLFFTCCTYIRMQFRLLKHDIEKMVSEEFASEEQFRASFMELVQWHQDLIEKKQGRTLKSCSSEKYRETIYSKSNLFNFLSSSLVICLTGFNVTTVDDVVVVVTFLTFLFMGLMQVFFLCFFADMLMRASIEVNNGVYNSLWYLRSPSVVKDLLLVQTRAQKPCKLTALGFADVNLTAFMRVLSTSWSYFALLQSIYNQ